MNQVHSPRNLYPSFTKLRNLQTAILYFTIESSWVPQYVKGWRNLIYFTQDLERLKVKEDNEI